MEPIEPDEVEIRRGESGVRLLITLLFFVIAEVIEAVLVLAILFGVLWALVTQAPPPERVRSFSNRVIGYFYRIARYLTYNEPHAPFPFSEFPAEVEPPDEPIAERPPALENLEAD
jgi:hypothetical protein